MIWKRELCTAFGTTETGRPRIQRQAWRLTSAPNGNDFGHVALFDKPNRWTHVVTFHWVRDWTMAYSVNSKGRTLIRGKSIDESLRGSILGSIIAECYRKLSVAALWASTKWLTPKCEQQAEPAKSARRKECDHMRSLFRFDKQSHVTEIVDVWRHSQLSCLSLNSWSTCFGSIEGRWRWRSYNWFYFSSHVLEFFWLSYMLFYLRRKCIWL